MGKKALLGAAGLALMLAGCGGGGEAASEATPTVPTSGGTYGSIGELKDAAVAAGVDCAVWDEHNKSELAIGSGNCGESYTMAIFLNESAVQDQIDRWKVLGDYIDFEVLVGENWTVSGPGAEELKDSMGGSIFRTNGKED